MGQLNCKQLPKITIKSKVGRYECRKTIIISIYDLSMWYLFYFTYDIVPHINLDSQGCFKA